MANKLRRQTVEYLKQKAFAEETVAKATKLLRQLPDGEERDYLREQLRNYLYNNGYSCSVTPECPILPEYKLLIRDDCNGDIYPVDKAYLSFHYRYALKNPDQKTHTPEEYAKALSKNEQWRKMAEFPTYYAVKNWVVDKMAEQNLPLNLIGAFQINDLRDFVRNNCGNEFTHYRKRISFVKKFISEREEEFRAMLNKNGVDHRYTDALVERMKRLGEAWNVLVCDENGQQIEGPEFDRHHTSPLYSPNDITCLREANDFKRLCLIEKNTHRRLHQLERATVRGGGMLHFEKIMVPENAACILNFQSYVRHDFDNPGQHYFENKPKHDNSIYLNKLAETVLRFSHLAVENKRGKTSDSYVHNGGRGSR